VRAQPILLRLTAAAAVSGLLIGPGLAPIAQAQPAPPAGAAAPAVDPPSRVGRLAQLQGAVSFHTADEDHWEAATLNYPVTSGNAFWTEPAAAASIEVGASHIALDQATEFDIATLDDHALVATEGQGAAYLRLRDVPQGDSFTINTPRGSVTIAAAGRYEVAAGDTASSTRITVVDGAAQVASGTLTLQVHAHQTVTLTGTDTFDGSVAAEADDAFLTAQLALERPQVKPAAYTPPSEVRQMTGGEAVEETGEWAATPEYGHVWYPPVQADWVPYRHGHWAYVAPWGWTWVDDAPWGFAPFHYGRWVQIDHRWGWSPVDASAPVVVGQRPVYAPALVSFVDVGAGVAVGAAAGVALGVSVGWIPLGPREVYRPPYRVSDRYLRQVNVSNVSTMTNITTVNNTTISTYVNRGAATVVPAAAMTGSQPVAVRAVQVTPQTLIAARSVTQAPVQPTLATRGVTPAVAQSLHLAAPAGGAVPVRTAVPGPAVTPHPAGGAAAVRPGLPILVPSHAGTGTPAVTGVKPGEAAVKPGEAAMQPGATVVKPGATVVKPGEAVVKPGAAVKPGEAVAKPGAAAMQPGATVVKPGEAVVKPGAAAMQPGEAVVKPGVAVMQPGAAVKPGEAVVKPGVAVVKPGAAAMQPGAAVVRPGAAAMQPGAAERKSGAANPPPAAPVAQAPAVQHQGEPAHAAPRLVQPHAAVPAQKRKECPAGHPNC
jgi:hypothetical protein